MKKKDIVDGLKLINKNPQWMVVMKQSNEGTRKVIEATNNDLVLPKFRRVQTLKDSEESGEQSSCDSVTLADSVPYIITASEGADVLAMTTVSDTAEKEFFACNVNEEEWADELLEVQICTDNDNEIINISRVETDETNSSIVNDQDSSTNLRREPDVTDKISIQDTKCISSLMKSSKCCNKRDKWSSVTPENLLVYFHSTEKLSSFLDVELRVVVQYLKKTKGIKLKESSSKMTKVAGIAEWLGLDNIKTDQMQTSKRKHYTVKKVKPLAEIAIKVIGQKVRKCELNVIQAEYLWPERYEHWIKDVQTIQINGHHYRWFYKPDFSESRNQYEVRCIDSTHLMTRTRRKCCKGGLSGISNESWLKVAKSGQTLLTQIMVEEITDPMSITIATTHFSEAVEVAMRKYGDNQSANLCKDVRQWWESEDKPGISAVERHKLRMDLRNRLLKSIDFSRFPPPTNYVSGWPIQLWEALLASIDSKAFLYCLSHDGSYNVRAFSSMIGETFFSELTLNDKRGQGTISCKEFGQFIGNAIEQVQIRLDPDRKFSYNTGRSTVYNLVDRAEPEYVEDDGIPALPTAHNNSLSENIILQDHNFDMPERGRLSGKKKLATISRDRHSLQKGSLGVRLDKARTNQSKMLPSQRMGIQCDPDKMTTAWK